jgi:hypothetical protein
MESKHEITAKIAAIDLIAANFGQTMNASLKVAWLELLAEFSANQVKQAALLTIERYDYKTMPPFAVLRKNLDEVTGQRTQSAEDERASQADAEWTRLLAAIQRFGGYREAEALREMHPSTTFALRGMGGWGAACQWKTDDLGHHRRTFVMLWKNPESQPKVAKALPEGEKKPVLPMPIKVKAA